MPALPRASRAPLLFLSIIAALAAPPALAHGPTVRVSFSGVNPPTLTIEVGTTVHFHNDGTTAVTVAAVDGSFEGPTLAAAEGWHHTFEQAGVFEYRLKESSRAKGKLVVYEPR